MFDLQLQDQRKKQLRLEAQRQERKLNRRTKIPKAKYLNQSGPKDSHLQQKNRSLT